MESITVKAKSTVIISFDDPSYDGRRPSGEMYPVEKGDLVIILHPWDLVRVTEEPAGAYVPDEITKLEPIK